jgi:putative DNA primase/helicase
LKGQLELLVLARGNPLLLYAICVGLSGLLLKILNVGSGGSHFYSASTVGKTIAQSVSYGRWTNPSPLPNWNATGNSLEARAAAHSDNFIALNEIGQAEPKTLETSVYRLGNESSRGRAYQDSQAQNLKEWRLVYISSGELTLEEYIGKTKTGVDIRLVNIPVPDQGMFVDLHGFQDSGKFAEHLEREARLHFGPIGPLFAKQFQLELSSNPEKFKIELERLMEEYMGNIHGKYLSKSSRQLTRVARRFAIAAVAGELVIRWKFLPWEPGEAMAACSVVFEAYADRQGRRDGEDQRILEAIFEAIQLRPNAFAFKGATTNNTDCLGDRREHNDRMYFGFTASGLKKVTGIKDTRRITRILDRQGWLDRDVPKSDRINKEVYNLYWIKPQAIEQFDS